MGGGRGVGGRGRERERSNAARTLKATRSRRTPCAVSSSIPSLSPSMHACMHTYIHHPPVNLHSLPTREPAAACSCRLPRHPCPSPPLQRHPPPTPRAKLCVSSPLHVLPQACRRCTPWFDPAAHSCTSLLTAASLRVEGGKDGGRTNDKEGQRRRESERARDRTGKMGAAKRQKVAVSTR